MALGKVTCGKLSLASALVTTSPQCRVNWQAKSFKPQTGAKPASLQAVYSWQPCRPPPPSAPKSQALMRALSLVSLSMKFSGLMSLHFMTRRRARAPHVSKARPPACHTARAQQVRGSSVHSSGTRSGWPYQRTCGRCPARVHAAPPPPSCA